MTPRLALDATPSVTRHFTDSVGVHWTVYGIIPSAALQDVIALFPHPERRAGWLLFESPDGDRRRLAPFPADWRTISPFELERWCMKATPVTGLPQRRAEDRAPRD